MSRLSFGLTVLALFAVTLPAHAWTMTTTTPKLSCQLKNAAIAVACGWTLTTSAAAQAVDVAAGSKIFEANCASCHPGGQNRIHKERTLQKEALETFVGLDPSDLQQYVRYDILHRGANLFGSELSDREIENAVAYVLEQAMENKW